MSHKWEETGHFRHLDMKGRYMGAMATEDSPKTLEGRHGDRKSPNEPGGVATWGRHGDLPCKWRPSSVKAWSPLRVAMATLMLQVATHFHFAGSPHMVAMAT